MQARPSLLFLTQAFAPDPAAVGQYMADAAREMASRGYRVVVVTSRGGYEDPSISYPARELWKGVEIMRLRFTSFGKRSIARRLLAATSFVAQAALRGLFVGNLKGVVFTTSPSLSSFAALVLGRLKSVPIIYWVMDVNPDQYVALYPEQVNALKVKALASLNRKALKAASVVVALDSFMAEKLRAQTQDVGPIEVIPPWPHDEHLEAVSRTKNTFRDTHRLEGHMVVMYSGNHSPVNPLDTFLQAALRFENDPRITFLFIGGGAGKVTIDNLIRTRKPKNVMSLPYQPLESVGQSLSAADVHVVTMGNPLVGIVHPCKVYGAMAVGRPILYFGPRPSPISELIEREGIGWCIEQGDIDGAQAILESILNADPDDLEVMGQRASDAIRKRLSKSEMCRRFGDVVERGVHYPADDEL